MKQLITIFSISALAYSCGNNAEQTPETKPAQEVKPAGNTPAPDSLSANPDYSKGLNLVAQSDCLTCHKVEDVNVGPSYRDVANKYEANKKNISLLADKIIKGGGGVWGQVPMTPHSTLSKKTPSRW